MALVGTRIPVLLALLAAGLAGMLIGSPRDYEGKRVSRILFEPALQPLPDAELTAMLPLKVGDALQLSAVRSSLARLFATGRYLDVAADASLVEGEVVLRFITRHTWFVGGVTVEGVPAPPSAPQLVNATRLQLGREFTEQQAVVAMESIQAVLRANGFYEARVERFLDYEAAFSQVNVLFSVTPGPRAKLAEPQIEGTSAAEAHDLAQATKWERFWLLPGYKETSEHRIQRGVERIRKYYQKRNYLLASVTLEDLRYDTGNKTLTPVVQINRGPRVRVETIGRDVSRGRLRKLLPMYQEQSVDRDLLVEGSRNLTEHFQSKGYFDTTVEFRTKQDAEDTETIEYAIDTGERYKLVALSFSGNDYFSDETLRERIAITPATRIRYRNGRYSEGMLEADLAAITNLYRTNGFRDVKLEARTEVPEKGAPQDVAVSIEVSEGPQWTVSELVLDGASEQHKEYILSMVSTVPNQPFSEANIARDRDTILAYYYNNGYVTARFRWESEENPETQQVRIRMVVEEGARSFVRATLVGGLRQSDPKMVDSRILLEPGDPLSQSTMVDTQRQLYDLGVFARVDQAIQNPGGEEIQKYILLRLEEARQYSLNFGFGAQIARIGGGGYTDFNNPAGSTGFSPRISFGVSRSNMFGVGHTASVQTRLSETRQRAALNYLAPHIKTNERLNINVTGLYDFSRDINTFESERIEGSFQFGQQLSRANSIRYRFAYRRVDTAEIKISPELIPVFAQPVRVGLVALDFVQDRRDDPLNSTRGYYNAIETSVASKVFGSQTDYIRLIGRNSSYYKIGRDMVLARSLTVGWQPNTASDRAGNPIPLPERIFSGGASSHRSFPDNQAGPRDLETGFVLGGLAMLMHNLELRFPLVGETVGGVLFWDAGNVYSTMGDVSFRFRQRDKKDFDYMVHSIGFGIRYRTPIGPIRLDLAFSPNSPRFFGFEGTLDDLINGQGRQIDQRINQFQFFFSIGQTF